MEVPDGYQQVNEPRGTAVVRSDVAAVPPDVWWGDGEPLSGAAGRGEVRVVEYRPGERGVARNYRRGGAMRLLGRRFLDPGRAARELAVRVALRQNMPPNSEGRTCATPANEINPIEARALDPPVRRK